MGKLIEPRILGFVPKDANTNELRVADKNDVVYPVFDSDGYSVLDRNSGVLLSVWVGTDEEYQAISHDPRVLYFVAGNPEPKLV